MVLWISRHYGYKLGFFGLIISTVVYVIAYAIPYWAVLHLRQFGMVDQTVGLWQTCVLRSSTCVSNFVGSNPPWLNAARATCSLALVLVVVALFCGYYRNFSRLGQERCQSPGRHVEGLAAMACFLGLSGAIIFAYQFHADYAHVPQHQRTDDGDSKEVAMGRLHWAYPLLCSALGLVGISACLMLLFNRQRYHAEPPRAASFPRRHCPRFSGGGEEGEGEGDRVHVPYLGEVWRTELVPGATPLQPPSYELATAGGASGTTTTTTGTTYVGYGYAAPPGDLSDAPPLYEDIGKDCVLSPPMSTPSRMLGPRRQSDDEVDDDGNGEDKLTGEEGSDPDRHQTTPGPPPPATTPTTTPTTGVAQASGLEEAENVG